MPRVRMVAPHQFQPPGRAEIALRPGALIFVTEEQKTEWFAKGIAQAESDPWPPSPPAPSQPRPLLYGPDEQPI